MPAYTVAQYQTMQRRRIIEINKVKRRGPITAAKYMTSQLRLLCPVGTRSHPYPHMYQTIKRDKNMVSISGVNPKTGFPYVFWVNEIPGFETINFKLPGKYNGMKMRFRDFKESPNASKAGFYGVALHRTRNFYADAMINQTRKALQSTF